MATTGRQQGGTSSSRRIGTAAAYAALVVLLGLGIAWGGSRFGGLRPAPVRAAEQTGPRLLSPADEAARPEALVASIARPAGGESSELPLRGQASNWAGGLEREAPRPPLGPSALADLSPKAPVPVVPAAPDPGLPRPTLLFKPVATAAGRIEVSGHVIELEGVEITDPARQCEGQGRSWPCGAVARAAFRAWMRGRAVECTVTPLPLPKPVSSLCKLGGKDMGEWLVRSGFAEASVGGAYGQAGQEARAAHRGLFGEGPKAADPAFTADEADAPAVQGSEISAAEMQPTDSATAIQP